jgi:hypothetical protein
VRGGFLRKPGGGFAAMALLKQASQGSPHCAVHFLVFPQLATHALKVALQSFTANGDAAAKSATHANSPAAKANIDVLRII